MNFGSLIPWREKLQVSNVHNDYADPFSVMRSEMDRAFRDFSNAFGTSWPEDSVWRHVAPALDVAETDKDVVVSAEIPGLDEKDVEVTLAGDVLTIRGEKKLEREHEKADAYYTERRYGSFARSVRLPFEAGEEAVDAKYDKGVLTVRVPKPQEARHAVRQIEVKAA